MKSSLPASTETGASNHRAAVTAGFSGWLLDAFDFFLVTFCLTSMAKEFHKTDAQIALVITMTLLFRPVGGFVFGMMADRYGRRLPLMINIGFFAVAEVFTGLATSYTMLLIVRALFGVVMGGNWGVGTSLAMEGAPKGKRGMLSGLLQEGYAAGECAGGVVFSVSLWTGWVEAAVFSRESTGDSAGSVYPVPGEGVDGVAEGANRELGRAGARGFVALEAVLVSAGVYDDDDVRLPRHAGYVSDVSAAGMALYSAATGNDYGDLRCGSDSGRDYLWPFFGRLGVVGRQSLWRSFWGRW